MDSPVWEYLVCKTHKAKSNVPAVIFHQPIDGISEMMPLLMHVILDPDLKLAQYFSQLLLQD